MVEEAPAIGQIGVPSLIGAGLLEHGLDSGDDIYVWANKASHSDVSSKLRAGFKLVKMDEVKARLEENGIPIAFYSEDAAGNVCYGVDLILMRGSKKYNDQLIRLALQDQLYLVNDASETEMQDKIEEALSRTDLKTKDRPRVSKDEDHGTKQTITIEEKR